MALLPVVPVLSVACSLGYRRHRCGADLVAEMSERPSDMEVQQAKTDAAHEQFITDREKVLAKWPDAVAVYFAGWDRWLIETNPQDIKGNGLTEPEAWADAARRLEDGKCEHLRRKCVYESDDGEFERHECLDCGERVGVEIPQ